MNNLNNDFNFEKIGLEDAHSILNHMDQVLNVRRKEGYNEFYTCMLMMYIASHLVALNIHYGANKNKTLDYLYDLIDNKLDYMRQEGL